MPKDTKINYVMFSLVDKRTMSFKQIKSNFFPRIKPNFNKESEEAVLIALINHTYGLTKNIVILIAKEYKLE